MGISRILITCIGLSADAFVISLCLGFRIKNLTLKSVVVIATYFSLSQALLPVVGFLLASQVLSFLQEIGHYLAFFVFIFLGISGIREGLEEDDEFFDIIEEVNLSPKVMIPLAIASSIDDWVIGTTFAILEVSILQIMLFF